MQNGKAGGWNGVVWVVYGKWGKYQEIYRDNMKNTDKIYVYKQNK